MIKFNLQTTTSRAMAALLLSSALILVGQTSVWAGQDLPDEKAKAEAQSAQQQKMPAQQAPAPVAQTQGKGQSQTQTQTQAQAPKPTQAPDQKQQEQQQGQEQGKMQGPDTWACSLTGRMSGLGVSVILGGQYISGRGTIQCTNNGQTLNYPVRLSVVSGGWGLDLTFILAMKVRAYMPSVVDPQALFGEYSIGSTSGATLLTQNIQFDSAVYVARTNAVSENNVGFEVAITSKDTFGLGVRLHGMIFSIESL